MTPTALATFGGLALVGYLLGSIPFGLVITKLAGLGDIRAIGSGNIGATNVLRTGRKDLALATLLLDAGKAGLAFFLCREIALRIVSMGFNVLDVSSARSDGGAFEGGLVGGAAAFVGHCFPVWLKFKGGKGVATFIGLLLAATWQVGLAFAATWLVMAALFRMSSAAALVASILAPVFVWMFGYGVFAVAVVATLTVMILWRHRANIERIFAGTEPKIGSKKMAETPP